MGQVLVTLTGDVTASKYRGQPPYVSMTVGGEARNYSCENDACAAALRGRRGQTLLIEATGRDATATINVYAAPPGSSAQQAAPQAPPPQQAPPPSPAPAPAPTQHYQPPAPAQPASATDPVGRVLELNKYFRGHANAMVLAARALMGAVESASKEMGVPFDDNVRRGVASNLIEDMAKGATVTAMLIRAERSGMLEGFPPGSLQPLLEAARTRTAAKQAPPPPPVPEPEDDVPM